jgi:mannose-6-phosphate isomerase-like protein (cupin superfamily)
MSAEPTILGPGSGRVISLRGNEMRVLSTAADCSGASSFEVRALPGFDTGLHVHARLEELFYVLDGRMELRAGDRIIDGRPGTFACVPVGVPHAFANRSDSPARMLLVSAPSGHERYFEELAVILAREGPPDSAAIGALRARYDTTQVSSLAT